MYLNHCHHRTPGVVDWLAQSALSPRLAAPFLFDCWVVPTHAYATLACRVVGAPRDLTLGHGSAYAGAMQGRLLGSVCGVPLGYLATWGNPAPATALGSLKAYNLKVYL